MGYECFEPHANQRIAFLDAGQLLCAQSIHRPDFIVARIFRPRAITFSLTDAK
jgi:hypothetical protein